MGIWIVVTYIMRRAVLLDAFLSWRGRIYACLVMAMMGGGGTCGRQGEDTRMLGDGHDGGGYLWKAGGGYTHAWLWP